jgi:hypothetical protein
MSLGRVAASGGNRIRDALSNRLAPVTGGPVDFERLAAFAALGGMFSLGYPKHRVLLLLFLVAIAGALEALQNLMPTRHGRIPDAAVKALGAAMGVFVAGRLATWCPNLFR